MTSWQIIEGDALERLRELPAESVQTCVTSPPYFGLRDYGTAEWEGGDEGCDHVEKASARNDLGPDDLARRAATYATGTGSGSAVSSVQFRSLCGKCGARRIDSQLGLESTPDEYVARLVEVFREVRRVLRDDGTLWLNLGDSYAAQGGSKEANVYEGKRVSAADWQPQRSPSPGTKPKDLLGIPWMVAFALRADGWYLRSDIIWAKPNPMPESVTDRPTKAHEYLFLLSKGPRYFYDVDAIREPPSDAFHTDRRPGISIADYSGDSGRNDGGRHQGLAGFGVDVAGRNRRSVWTVATQPFPGAHFAVFPPKLIEPCVLAGSAEQACGVCGAPWERVVEKMSVPSFAGKTEGAYSQEGNGVPRTGRGIGSSRQFYREHGMEGPPAPRTVGWQPTCIHVKPGLIHLEPTAPEGSCTVLDPFAGAGTTGLIATRHNRSFIGIELNPAYAEMARDRIATAERLGHRPPERGPEPVRGQLGLEL